MAECQDGVWVTLVVVKDLETDELIGCKFMFIGRMWPCIAVRLKCGKRNMLHLKRNKYTRHLGFLLNMQRLIHFGTSINLTCLWHFNICGSSKIFFTISSIISNFTKISFSLRSFNFRFNSNANCAFQHLLSSNLNI